MPVPPTGTVSPMTAVGSPVSGSGVNTPSRVGGSGVGGGSIGGAGGGGAPIGGGAGGATETQPLNVGSVKVSPMG